MSVSLENYDLDAWADRWDKEIELWFQDPQAFWNTHPLFSAYSGNGKSAVVANCLPEPYLGDIRPSQKRHTAVLLNLNPGAPNDFQAYPEKGRATSHALYTKRVREVGYRQWAKNNPYNPLTNHVEKKTIYEGIAHEGGEKFWSNRNRWLKEMNAALCGKNESPLPFCLEIFPFHSKSWGRYNGERAKEWIEEWVLKPAVALAGRAEISSVICVGKSFRDLFMDVLKYECDLAIGSDERRFPDSWPMKSSGKPYNRSFFRFQGLGGTFFVTYHPGGNKLPGSTFKEICRTILSFA